MLFGMINCGVTRMTMVMIMGAIMRRAMLPIRLSMTIAMVQLLTRRLAVTRCAILLHALIAFPRGLP
jgi:hypothetical protein